MIIEISDGNIWDNPRGKFGVDSNSNFITQKWKKNRKYPALSKG